MPDAQHIPASWQPPRKCQQLLLPYGEIGLPLLVVKRFLGNCFKLLFTIFFHVILGKASQIVPANISFCNISLLGGISQSVQQLFLVFFSGSLTFFRLWSCWFVIICMTFQTSFLSIFQIRFSYKHLGQNQSSKGESKASLFSHNRHVSI